MNTPEIVEFKVPIGETEYRFTEKGSKFLGWAAPADSPAAALDLIASRSRLYHDATHNCWAYRAGKLGAPDERSSDDGEPSGTAGRPILDAIRGSDLVNVLVVVTRWFGGTKLGKGGLIRAYGGCAAETLKLVRHRIVIPQIELIIECPYDMIGWVEKVVKLAGGAIINGVYHEEATLKVKLPTEMEMMLRSTVQADGGGRVTIRTTDLTEDI